MFSFIIFRQQEDKDKALETSRREKARADAEYMRQVLNYVGKQVMRLFLHAKFSEKDM